MLNTPNVLTLVRMVLIPVFMLFYYLGIDNWNLYAGVIFIIASLTDMLDGMIARKKGLVTNFGKFADPIADKLLVAAALFILLEEGMINGVLTFILIAREFIISGFRMVAASSGVVLAAGSIGKAKTVVQMVGIIVMLLLDPYFNPIGWPIGLILMYASAVLSIWSCVDYIVRNRALLKETHS